MVVDGRQQSVAGAFIQLAMNLSRKALAFKALAILCALFGVQSRHNSSDPATFGVVLIPGMPMLMYGNESFPKRRIGNSQILEFLRKIISRGAADGGNQIRFLQDAR
jgi:hypothetical protein